MLKVPSSKAEVQKWASMSMNFFKHETLTENHKTQNTETQKIRRPHLIKNNAKETMITSCVRLTVRPVCLRCLMRVLIRRAMNEYHILL